MISDIFNKNRVLILWNEPEDMLPLVQPALDGARMNEAVVRISSVADVGQLAVEKEKFDIAVFAPTFRSMSRFPDNQLSSVTKALVPGGKFIVSETVSLNEEESMSLRSVGAMKLAVMSAGFQIESEETKSSWDNGRTIELRCMKPKYSKGAVTKLKFSFGKKKGKENNSKKAWKLALDDEDDDELEDEDSLFDSTLSAKRKTIDSEKMDCGTSATGKRRACKDCSCGLAEVLEEADAAAIEAAMNKKSNCGNCYKGDAFRCASCPHRGKPAFKPGEKVVLDL
eukprot:g4352.t1